MALRLATDDDLAPLLVLKDTCIARMRADGIEQRDEVYPAAAMHRIVVHPAA